MGASIRRTKNLKPLIPSRCVCVCLSNFVFQSGILIIVKRERVFEKCTQKILFLARKRSLNCPGHCHSGRTHDTMEDITGDIMNTHDD